MNLLVTGCFKYTEEQLNLLKKYANVYYLKNESDEITFDVSKIDVAIVNNLFLYHDVKKFTNLKVVQVTSAGLDRVPIDYFNTNNIKYFNAKDVYSIPMAEFVLSKILEIYKKSTFFYKNQKNKIWCKNRELIELSGKNACIVGTGSVGLEIAKRLKAFDVKVSGVDIYINKKDFIDEVYSVDDIKIALKKSDIVILTLPLTEKTKNMFNYDLLKSIQENSILINVSRGAIINEFDLIKCINEKHFMEVVLDVFEEEPLNKESELWEKAIISPHNSFVSCKNNERLFNVIIKNLFSN